MILRFLSLLLCFSGTSSHAALLLSRNSEWKYLKGTAEASDPVDAWTGMAFDDSAWSTGFTPIRYGDGSGGTELSDMRGNYTTVFMRRSFNVQEAALISQLDLNIDWDDGYAVWINGVLVHSRNPPADYTHDATASESRESGDFQTFEIPEPQGFLLEGENIIAIQVFNISLTSSDLFMNPELVSIAPDFDPPLVSSFSPPPGNVNDLSLITVTFSEPVTGVDAGDLTINGSPALSVQPSGDRYTFGFATQPIGPAIVEWVQDHGIRDTARPPNPFDANGPGEARNYVVVDLVPPVTSGILPPRGLTIRQIREISVGFSEPVSGVNAGDLLAGGVPATTLTGSGSGPYLFTFDALPPGPLPISWAPDHGIVDFAADPNSFVGTGWSYTLDPNASDSSLRISEFMAANRDGLKDEDGEASDWIELHNYGDIAIDLEGWALTDDEDEPSKFVFPARVIRGGEYLLVFASGKDRRPPREGEIHTNFKLSASGEHLALLTPELPRAVADQLSPVYPVQRNNYSYGRENAGGWVYYSNPTPRSTNGTSSVSEALDPPHANVARGFYSRPFDLHLTSNDPRATIRYTTDGSEPTSRNGTVYSGPIRISTTRIVRAASFRTGALPSRVVTHTYLYNASAAIRSLPVVSLSTDNSNLWGSIGIQEPRNTPNRGIAWERPVSAELIKPDNSGFQVNCGLRVQGGDYIRGRYDPNAGPPRSKYSFRLYFRGDYGPTMLEYPFFEGSPVKIYDRITLRAGMNDHSNPFVVDEYMRRMQIESGRVGARGNFVNLFINGDYKGYYNPTERIDDDFMRSWHGGDNDWDVIAQFGEVREGDSVAWNNMRTVVQRDLSDPANYQAALEVLDVDNFIDYLLVNVYGYTGDWPHNNWRAARERVPGARFRFYVWDAEWSLGNQGRSVNGNTLTGELGGGSDIARLYRSLLASPEFRLRWADRVHKLFFNGGPFEDDRNLQRYEELRNEMSSVLPNMSTQIRTNWVPNRRGVIIGDMRDADLYRSDEAPVFSQFGGPVSSAALLTMSAPGGTIYYTTNGRDPRSPLDPDAGGFSRELVSEQDSRRVLIPANDSLGRSWTGANEPFSDEGWTLGTGGVGYDEQDDYRNLIEINVESEMNNENTSCYIRIPFTVTAADLEDVNFMQLRARFDDGFAAFLNGIRIIGPNAPATLTWNSSATANNPDAGAVNLNSFNVTEFLGELRVGSNILAVHGLNDGLGSSDFLNSTVLEVGRQNAGQPDPEALVYNRPFPISRSQHIKARTFHNGEWSALTEATFHRSPDIPALCIREIMYNPAGPTALEFVELENVGDLPVDLNQMSLRGIGFTFAEGAVLAAGERLVLASNDNLDAFTAHYPGVDVFGTFSGSLSNGGERLRILDSLGNTVHSVRYADSEGWPTTPDGGGHSLVLLNPDADSNDAANWSASVNEDGSPGQAEPASPPPPVLINEVLANNRSALQLGDEFPSFLELRNPGPDDLSLADWGLSDDGGSPRKFTFPSGAKIPAGGYLVIWFSTAPGLPGFNTGFDLDPDGATIFLNSPSGVRTDALTYGAQIADLSLARGLDGWQLTTPTPGLLNAPPALLAPQSAITLNEWMTNRVPGASDWLELHNTDGTRPVALHHLHIRHGTASARYAYLSFLPPKGHLRLWAGDDSGARQLDLRLQAGGGTLELIDRNGLEIETLTYPAQFEDISSGRYPDGGNAIQVFEYSASPGAPNYLRRNEALRINEFQAGQAGRPGWLEISNTRASAYPLAHHSLALGHRGAPRWSFPDSLDLAGNGHLVIALDPSRPPSNEPGALSISSPLVPEGGEVYLFDPEGRELDRLHYGNQIPGFTIGRAADSNWQLLASPTPGGTNSGSAALTGATSLRINEWLANPGEGQEDFVELYNISSSRPIALAGLRLTDNLTTGGIDQYAIPPLSFISPGGFVRFIADGGFGPGHLPFGLHSDGETLRLHQARSASIIDEVTWGVERAGVSSGRLNDGGANIGPLPFQSPAGPNTVDPDADSDGDGIPDRWEITYGLDPDSPTDTLGDLDNDLRSNLFEYRSNTDPTDPSSFLQFSFDRDPGTGLVLQFHARPGIRYTIEESPDLVTWSEFAVIQADSAARSERVMTPHESGSLYYRLVAERPN